MAAEAELEQARLSLADAEEALAKATLTAPFAGVVTAVHVSAGEYAGGLAVEIVDPASLEVVLNVDEVDIGALAVGQTAVVTLEAWPDEEIAGEIRAIAPAAASDSSGIVSYEVRLSLQETDLPILAGMTANANLITANRENVLLAPNAALTVDRENGAYSVNVKRVSADGNVDFVPVEVTIGLRDRDYTQITSGLAEGDEVLIGEFSAPTQSFGFGPGS